MISANISRTERRAIYERDGFRCALCDSTKYLQVHHHVPRGEGGTNSPHNLITLCSDCHALAHGTNLRDWQDVTQESINQAVTEYLADYYAPAWNPWATKPLPCDQCPQRRFCTHMEGGIRTCRKCRWPEIKEDCPFTEADPP